uniref:RNase H type-1 domain-containing protein n=1 Tax=Quercus lobata TaxID=97700 RepID=A0A7N2LG05_QUELO
MGVGVLIWDHEGSVVATMSKHLPLPLGPLEAEGKAMDEAVTFAWDIGVRDVVFEIDSRIVFDAFRRTITPPIAVANLIDGIHHKLHSFRATCFLHVLRHCNNPAHSKTCQRN